MKQPPLAVLGATYGAVDGYDETDRKVQEEEQGHRQVLEHCVIIQIFKVDITITKCCGALNSGLNLLVGRVFQLIYCYQVLMLKWFKFKNIAQETTRSILAHNQLLRRKLYTSVNPSIHHIETLPTLADHANQYNDMLKNMENTSYAKDLQHNLNYAEQNLKRSIFMAKRYVQGGGQITAQTIANMYAVKHIVNSDEWYSLYLEPKIAGKVSNMSIDNIYHILNALKGTSSPAINLLLQQLTKRQLVDYQPVQYLTPHRTDAYAYCDQKQISCCENENPLFKALRDKTPYPLYWIQSVFAYVWDHATDTDGVQFSNYRLAPEKPHTASDVKRLVDTHYKNNPHAKTILSGKRN